MTNGASLVLSEVPSNMGESKADCRAVLCRLATVDRIRCGVKKKNFWEYGRRPLVTWHLATDSRLSASGLWKQSGFCFWIPVVFAAETACSDVFLPFRSGD